MGEAGWASLTSVHTVKHAIRQRCLRERCVRERYCSEQAEKVAELSKQVRSVVSEGRRFSKRQRSHRPHSDLSSVTAETLQPQHLETGKASTLELEGSGSEPQLP